MQNGWTRALEAKDVEIAKLKLELGKLVFSMAEGLGLLLKHGEGEIADEPIHDGVFCDPTCPFYDPEFALGTAPRCKRSGRILDFDGRPLADCAT